MSKITFNVSSRDLKKDKNNLLRAQNMIPGNVYKAGQDSIALKFSAKKFNKLYDQAGDTNIVYLKIDNQKERPTLVDEVQYHPVSDQIIHVSFKEVDLNEKIEAEVPVELVGEFNVKEAVLVHVRNSILVKALPTDLPEKFEVNIDDLTQVGQMISLADLDFDRAKINLVEVETEKDWSKPVVLVQEQQTEAESETESATDSDGEEVAATAATNGAVSASDEKKTNNEQEKNKSDQAN